MAGWSKVRQARLGTARQGRVWRGRARLGAAGRSKYAKAKGERVQYRFKAGSRCAVGAQEMGEACERLESRGALTPAALVDEARPEGSPIHGCFEWDDAAAAEIYRQKQAGYYIRSLEVVPVGAAEPVRAFVSITPVTASRTRGYMSVEVAMASEDTRAVVLDRAKRELIAFRDKYRQLDELAGVFAAIDEVTA